NTHQGSRIPSRPRPQSHDRRRGGEEVSPAVGAALRQRESRPGSRRLLGTGETQTSRRYHGTIHFVIGAIPCSGRNPCSLNGLNTHRRKRFPTSAKTMFLGTASSRASKILTPDR